MIAFLITTSPSLVGTPTVKVVTPLFIVVEFPTRFSAGWRFSWLWEQAAYCDFKLTLSPNVPKTASERLSSFFVVSASVAITRTTRTVLSPVVMPSLRLENMLFFLCLRASLGMERVSVFVLSKLWLDVSNSVSPETKGPFSKLSLMNFSSAWLISYANPLFVSQIRVVASSLSTITTVQSSSNFLRWRMGGLPNWNVMTDKDEDQTHRFGR